MTPYFGFAADFSALTATELARQLDAVQTTFGQGAIIRFALTLTQATGLTTGSNTFPKASFSCNTGNSGTFGNTGTVYITDPNNSFQTTSITYTGANKTATSITFTGCSGGSGTFASGSYVTDGSYVVNYSATDAIYEQAATRGLRCLINVNVRHGGFSPGTAGGYAAPPVVGSGSSMQFNAGQQGGYRAGIKNICLRYGPNGTFWSSIASTTAKANGFRLDMIECLNEPNTTTGGSSPSDNGSGFANSLGYNRTITTINDPVSSIDLSCMPNPWVYNRTLSLGVADYISDSGNPALLKKVGCAIGGGAGNGGTYYMKAMLDYPRLQGYPNYSTYVDDIGYHMYTDAPSTTTWTGSAGGTGFSDIHHTIDTTLDQSQRWNSVWTDFIPMITAFGETLEVASTEGGFAGDDDFNQFNFTAGSSTSHLRRDVIYATPQAVTPGPTDPYDQQTLWAQAAARVVSQGHVSMMLEYTVEDQGGLGKCTTTKKVQSGTPLTLAIQNERDDFAAGTSHLKICDPSHANDQVVSINGGSVSGNTFTCTLNGGNSHTYPANSFYAYSNGTDEYPWWQNTRGIVYPDGTFKPVQTAMLAYKSSTGTTLTQTGSDAIQFEEITALTKIAGTITVTDRETFGVLESHSLTKNTDDGSDLFFSGRLGNFAQTLGDFLLAHVGDGPAPFALIVTDTEVFTISETDGASGTGSRSIADTESFRIIEAEVLHLSNVLIVPSGRLGTGMLGSFEPARWTHIRSEPLKG